MAKGCTKDTLKPKQSTRYEKNSISFDAVLYKLGITIKLSQKQAKLSSCVNSSPLEYKKRESISAKIDLNKMTSLIGDEKEMTISDMRMARKVTIVT